MIKNVAQLFDALIKKEAAILDRVKINHPPTIGAMYEGLTKSLVGRHLPGNVDLRVISGFAEGEGGAQSKQLDCMVVIGNGRPIPHTDLEIMPQHQVVAVIEVKKNLDPGDIKDGYLNLASVSALRPMASAGFRMAPVRTAFQAIAGVYLDSWKTLPPELQMLYHFLVTEAALPTRVLLGYHGHKTERGMRKAVSTFLESKTVVGNRGLGPVSIPSLIVNQQLSMAKLNGFPWATRMDEDGFVPLLASNAINSTAEVLLEVIWSRLNYLGLAGVEVFGEDLDLTPWNRLLSARHVAGAGWEYLHEAAKVPGGRQQTLAMWNPVELTDTQHAVVVVLCALEELDVANPPTNAPPREELLAALGKLAASGLVGEDGAGSGIYRLLTKNCGVVFLPDGRCVAGENASGRLTRWLEKYIEARRSLEDSNEDGVPRAT